MRQITNSSTVIIGAAEDIKRYLHEKVINDGEYCIVLFKRIRLLFRTKEQICFVYKDIAAFVKKAETDCDRLSHGTDVFIKLQLFD